MLVLSFKYKGYISVVRLDEFFMLSFDQFKCVWIDFCLDVYFLFMNQL